MVFRPEMENEIQFNFDFCTNLSDSQACCVRFYFKTSDLVGSVGDSQLHLMVAAV